MRWPRPSGARVSTTRTPSESGVSMRARRSASGGVPSTPTRGIVAGSRPPSSGRPRPSSTRPSSCSPTWIESGRPVAIAVSPAPMPATEPSGRQVARWPSGPSCTATTSAATTASAASMWTSSPTRGEMPRTAIDSPRTWSTWPQASGRPAAAAAATVWRMRSATLVMRDRLAGHRGRARERPRCARRSRVPAVVAWASPGARVGSATSRHRLVGAQARGFEHGEVGGAEPHGHRDVLSVPQPARAAARPGRAAGRRRG